MRRALRATLIGAVLVLALAGAALWGFNHLTTSTPLTDRRPDLKAVAPLEPVTRTSVVIVPIAVATLAIRDVMETHAPRDFSGTHDNPYGDLLGKSEISFTATRGAIQIASGPQGIDISTVIDGTARLSGQATSSPDNIQNRLGGILSGRLGRQAQDFAGRTLQRTAEIRGNVAVNAKPVLLPNWRFDPKLSGQATMGDVRFAGFQFNVTNQIKPSLDKAMSEQMAKLSDHLRNDAMLEAAVRPEWAKLCRSISLGQTVQGAPPLWLEVRPTKAIAAQPRFDREWVNLAIGLQAETRIVPNETKPDCPFPAELDIVPRLDQGKISVAVPIDIPLAELNRVMEEQLKGKTFPDDPQSPGQVTVLSVKLAASGDRLLVSLHVKARETKSWFGLTSEAIVHLWGKPALDPSSQIMRLRDVSLDVESETRLLGAAARAAIPYVRAELEKNAVIDLKPFTADARASIETMLADFKRPIDGIEIEAAITGLRLADIAFDAKTVRVTGEVQGTARALLIKIPTR